MYKYINSVFDVLASPIHFLDLSGVQCSYMSSLSEPQSLILSIDMIDFLPGQVNFYQV